MKMMSLIPYRVCGPVRGVLPRVLTCTALVVGLSSGAGIAQLPVAQGAIDQAPVDPSQTLPEPTETNPAQVPHSPEPVLGEETSEAKASAPIVDGGTIAVRPPARMPHIPRTRWQHMEGHSVWTRAALSALKSHGRPLVEMVPGDIVNWCPAYARNDEAKRRAFWVGYMSALAKHESTYKPWAVGGGGKWYGLLQILPATARGYKCNVGTGEALKNGAANLSCGVRIMAYTVKRDGVIHGRDSKWRGVSADWGPMRNASKRRDMAGWLKRQNYCTLRNAVRPRTRP